MTKKEYIKFAKLLKWFAEDNDSGQVSLDTVVSLTADIFQEDNPRFDRTRFFNAVYKED